MEHGNKRATTLPLEEGAERLLRWLERYPFQRGEDILLALSPWERRTTVYRHLAELSRLHLIEAFHAGIVQRKNLYTLSPFGAYVCDFLAFQGNPESLEKRRRWERWEHSGAGSIVREEREKLCRLLPRLPIFVLLQESVNSLISHAGPALTRQGHHASLIQWNWLRDYDHSFLSLRARTFRLHVEGALTLRLRFPQEPVDSENWYSVLLLHCPLDEARLIRARLDRLLRWRESAERAAVYSQMPPIFILATTERQAEWWHQAAIQAASQLQMDLPQGAVTCLPRDTERFPNFWHLPFRRLGTKEWCHAQELLHPWTAPSVPELRDLRGEASRTAGMDGSGIEKKKVLTLSLPSRLQRSSFAMSPDMRHTTRPGNVANDYRAASVLLTARQWEMLRLCFAHPLLSRDDFAQLLRLSRTTTNQLLADLKRAHYLAGIETLTGERWQVDASGLRLLARLASCHVHRLVRFPLEEGQPLMQRGVRGLLHQVRHTAGVYSFFGQLSTDLASHAHASLLWWETGVISERHFSFRDKIYRFRPDALATMQVGERTFRFWLEWDRGTMTLKNQQQKFTTYTMYLASREWARSSPYLPALLCVAPEIGQEKQLVKAARLCLVQAPSGFVMYTTTAQLLLTQGILGPIWRKVDVSENQSTSSSPLERSSRKLLFPEEEGDTP